PTYGEPATVDALPLDWFYGPGVVLDLTGRPSGVAGADDLRAAFARAGHEPRAGEIVLLNTGAAARCGTEAFFTDFVGLDAAAVGLLLDLGIRVVGTDAFSLDAPFGWM